MTLFHDFPTLMLISSATGLLSAYMAHRRGRNPFLWFAAGFLFGLLGIFAFLFIGPKKKQPIAEMPLKPIPQPYLFGPSDKFWYYLDEAHAQCGPMSYAGITNVWKQGNLPPTTLVWHEELTEWKPLQELIRLQE